MIYSSVNRFFLQKADLTNFMLVLKSGPGHGIRISGVGAKSHARGALGQVFTCDS